MIIGFWILFNLVQLLSTTKILSNCSFSHQIYFDNSAVYNQIQLVNQTSIILQANYAFSSASISTFQLGLIYQFSSSNSLVPFPILFNCASTVQSCQLKTMTSTSLLTTRDSESIRVQLTSFNFTTTTTSMPFKAMGLYLKQGRYQLSNCSLNNGQQMTDSQTVFNIQIQYEKSVGSSCVSTHDTCGSSLLTNCSASLCTCLSSSSTLVSYSNSFYCADMMNHSNCTLFPSRCITWCNQTKNYLCICPSDTLKIQRNQLFSCELPVNSPNCFINDIRRCPLGQCCYNEHCLDCSMIRATQISKAVNSADSFDDSLRIALGVIAGLLGVSMIVLFTTFCWLRRRRITTNKSLSNSSTSSLYISPIQQPVKFSASHPIFSRTDSFRQAVLSGQKTPHIIERVSTQRDSYIYEKNGWSSPTFSTLEFVIPPETQEIDQQTSIYQIVLPATPILTHTV